MEKSEGAYRTIGEAADELDLPQHVLRFWETRFSQISPMKRSGGRRYYRPEDLELLAAIRHLLYGEGYTIKGVQRILKQQGVRAVVELVSQLKEGGGVGVVAATAVNPATDAAQAAAQADGSQSAPADGVTQGGPGEASGPNRHSGQAEHGDHANRGEPVQHSGSGPDGAAGPALRPGLSPAAADKLKALLGEIEACARMLETARSS